MQFDSANSFNAVYTAYYRKSFLFVKSYVHDELVAEDIVYHNLHWDGYGVDHKHIGAQIPFAGIDKGFHTFGLEWTKDAYIFYVDGKETWRTSSAVSQRKEFMILSTELTGWGGDPALGNFPDEVGFDYVRVYQLKP